MVEKIITKLPNVSGLAKYYDIDEDNATKDIVLLMEFIPTPTLRETLTNCGPFEVDPIRIITYNILHHLKDLLKIDCYHGRLNMNNIHVDNSWNVKLTDYSYMSIIDKEAEFTSEEGSRLDIFCLGICILKMLGKIHIDDGVENNIDTYLENMDLLKQSYHQVCLLLFAYSYL